MTERSTWSGGSNQFDDPSPESPGVEFSNEAPEVLGRKNLGFQVNSGVLFWPCLFTFCKAVYGLSASFRLYLCGMLSRDG